MFTEEELNQEYYFVEYDTYNNLKFKTVFPHSRTVEKVTLRYIRDNLNLDNDRLNSINQMEVGEIKIILNCLGILRLGTDLDEANLLSILTKFNMAAHAALRARGY